MRTAAIAFLLGAAVASSAVTLLSLAQIRGDTASATGSVASTLPNTSSSGWLKLGPGLAIAAGALTFNSARVPTHDMIHNNETFCNSTNGTQAYKCSLGGNGSALTGNQVGQVFLLIVDTTCLSSCSLNIDGVGAASVKRIDGVTDPSGQLIAGQPRFVYFDGAVFRLM